MDRFFAFRYPGDPFELFGPAHLGSLVLAAAFGALFLRAGVTGGEDRRRRLRIAFAVVLLANELGRHAWGLSNGSWTIQRDLPLQMCGAMVWVTALALLFNARRIFPVVYFFGVAGAVQGVVTPDAGVYGLPHYIAVETIFSHACLVTGGLWVVIVEGFRPTIRHFWLIFGGLNLAALFMFFLNGALGSNYLFVNAKPPNASLVDLLPPWPWYILWLEVIAAGFFFLLYLPFARRSDPTLTSGGPGPEL